MAFAPLLCVIIPFALVLPCIIGHIMPVRVAAGFFSGAGLGAGVAAACG